jgi:cobalt/nickel transport system permease protein
VLFRSGAFVFAAQMVNFTIPGTGSSGHIGGGILLAAMLGGPPALLSITAVLLIQCLFFADGGLLALGCNIFNIGVIPCLVVYPLIFRPVLRGGVTMRKLTAASIIAAVVGLQLGAFGVVAQTALSGVAALPLGAFALLMQPIHLAIGLVEGLITAAVLCFVYKMRPELIESTLGKTAMTSAVPVKRLVAVFAVVTVAIGGALSLFASQNPDGLEWSLERVAGTAELEATGPVMDSAAGIQDAAAILPDYNFKNAEEAPSGTALAGIIGGGVTFLLAGATAAVISLVKKKRENPQRESA